MLPPYSGRDCRSDLDIATAFLPGVRPLESITYLFDDALKLPVAARNDLAGVGSARQNVAGLENDEKPVFGRRRISRWAASIAMAKPAAARISPDRRA